MVPVADAPPDVTGTPERARMRTIPALDGLRAVAVVAVLAFHGGISWAPGGFLGVDVFFVLSGYLITTLLLRERVATGRIDLRAFWVRRLRRLLPALLVLVAAVGIAAPWLVSAAELRSLRGDALASLAYVANWRFIVTDQSYFAGTPSPLRHLWSLAVEEQWYLLFPIVIAFGLRRTRWFPAVLVALVVATLASAVWMAHLASGPVDPSRAYYGTDTRAHSLLVGAVLALVAAQWPLHRARRTLSVLGLLGAGAVVGAFVVVHESDRWMYQGGFLLVAVATAGVVGAVALPHQDTLLARALALAPLVAIGRISYGLYLWHWPVNVALTPERTGLDGHAWWEEPALLAVRTAAAVALALASYHLVEQRVRHGGLDGLRLRLPGPARSRPATAVGLVALTAWIVVAGTAGVRSATAPDASTGLPPRLASAERGVPDLPVEPVPTIPAELAAAIEAEGIAPVPPDRPVRVMVVGDSVAWTLSYATPEVPATLEMSSAALIGCGLVDGYALPGGKVDTSSEECDGWSDYWQVQAAATAPDVVLVQFGAWEVYDHLVDGRTVRSGTAEMRDLVRAGLDRGVGALLAVDPAVRLVFVGSPCMRERDARLGGASSERNDPERVAWVNEVISDYAADVGPRAVYLDLGELLCPDGRFLEAIDGVEVRPDGSHYGDGTSDAVWRWFEPRIVAHARTPVPGPPSLLRGGAR